MRQGRRVGARTPDAVPADVRAALEAGEPSANHMEQIAMDMGRLLSAALPELAAHAGRLRAGGLVTRMRTGGAILLEAFGDRAAHVALACSSDTVRGWGAMAAGARYERDAPAALGELRPFADDSHFAVREWAWLAFRPIVVDDCDGALRAVRPWADDPSPRVRRFASESTRPRGVWSAHVPELKRHPERGEGLLDALRRDDDRYVQDSVANWINDASRSRPDWAERICAAWLAGSTSTATERICRRGLRTLRRAS